jgi:hypothetical protein
VSLGSPLFAVILAGFNVYKKASVFIHLLLFAFLLLFDFLLAKIAKTMLNTASSRKA